MTSSKENWLKIIKPWKNSICGCQFISILNFFFLSMVPNNCRLINPSFYYTRKCQRSESIEWISSLWFLSFFFFFLYLLCVRNCATSSMYVISFDLQNFLVRKISSFQLYRWGNWDSEKSSNLPNNWSRNYVMVNIWDSKTNILYHTRACFTVQWN